MPNVELSPEDRQEIWEGLERRMEEWEAKHPRRTRRRPRGLWLSLGGAVAVLAGVVVTYSWLGLGGQGMEQAGPPAPPASHLGASLTPAAKIADIQRLASEGRVPDCPFVVRAARMSDVEQAWGQADKTDAAGKGLYATYAERGFAFGFLTGEPIFDVRSYAQDLREIRLSLVKRELGNPLQVNRYQDQQYDQDIWVYQSGDYLLQLVFPHVTDEAPDPALDHVSVTVP